MLSALLVYVLLQSPPEISRSSYGVPVIHAKSAKEAFYFQGYATAEDRLWQMDLSRHQSEGRLGLLLGKNGVAADVETLKSSYTDEEIDKQLASLNPETREAFEAYAQGVNAYIADAQKSGTLPDQYAKRKLTPEPWSTRDSAAIAIRLLQLFGRMGAGDARNWLLLNYLTSRPNLKGMEPFQVANDLLFENDADSPTTLDPADDTSHRKVTKHSPEDLKRSYDALPKASLFELMPTLRLSAREETTRVAMTNGLPYKTGSYAVVVSKQRSANGWPILLSAPQMGLSNPTVVHEVILDAPGLQVGGIAVPGVPGLAIGHTPNLAWGLTTGVGDQEDIFISKLVDKDRYQGLNGVQPFQVVKRQVQAAETRNAQEVVQERTNYGPVIARLSSGYVASRRSAVWMQELKTIDALFGVYSAKSAKQVQQSIKQATTNFNFFYATRAGDIGWQYTGLHPIRGGQVDPRLPVMDTAENAWKGMIPFEVLPHVMNPSGGLLSNWNNKPATWWNNGDTPAFGSINHVDELRLGLKAPKLSEAAVEAAIWQIARRSEGSEKFRPYFPKGSLLENYDGNQTDGSIEASVYNRWVSNVRKALFLKVTGDFFGQGLFEVAIQPSAVLNALRGKTSYDYLKGTSAAQVSEQALASIKDPARYVDNGFSYPGMPPVAYGNRGTYIQIVSLNPQGVSARTVLPPGNAERGEHATDQIALARQWTYKFVMDWAPDKN